jgi:hypothetical protein
MSGKQSPGSFHRYLVHIVQCLVAVLIISDTAVIEAQPQPGGTG